MTHMSKPHVSKKMSLPHFTFSYIIIKSINNNISTAFLPHTSIIIKKFYFYASYTTLGKVFGQAFFKNFKIEHIN